MLAHGLFVLSVGQVSEGAYKWDEDLGTSLQYTSGFLTGHNQSPIFLDLFCLRGRFPSLPSVFLRYYTMILQRIRILVGYAGFEPGTSAPEIWCASKVPPHLHLSSDLSSYS